jgi:hypothetical protein
MWKDLFTRVSKEINRRGREKIMGGKENHLINNGYAKGKILLAKHEKVLTRRCFDHLKILFNKVSTLEGDWERGILDEIAFILNVCKGREALRRTLLSLEHDAREEKSVTHRYQVSSLFLLDCWKYLVSDLSRNEKLHLITGTVTDDGTRILSRMETVKFERQSAAYVKADDIDTHLKIVSLTEKHGHLLLAMFHSHMSHGANSTNPSAIDIANQERFMKLGCGAIGGIFSLDGHIRFFSTDKPFSIDVYGHGVKKLHDESKQKLFQLENADEEIKAKEKSVQDEAG